MKTATDSKGRKQPPTPEEVAQDWEDLARSVDGDSAAFRRLVEKHQRRLFLLCNRMLGDRQEAEDAVQEVFLKAFRKASTFRPKGQLFTLLYRIASNHCLNVLRRRKIVQFLRFTTEKADDGEVMSLDPADDAPSPHEALEQQQKWNVTKRRLESLPPGQRTVLVLVKFEGLSYKETSAALEITVGAVESRLFRAMRALEKTVEEEKL